MLPLAAAGEETGRVGRGVVQVDQHRQGLAPALVAIHDVLAYWKFRRRVAAAEEDTTFTKVAAVFRLIGGAAYGSGSNPSDSSISRSPLVS